MAIGAVEVAVLPAVDRQRFASEVEDAVGNKPITVPVKPEIDTAAAASLRAQLAAIDGSGIGKLSGQVDLLRGKFDGLKKQQLGGVLKGFDNELAQVTGKLGKLGGPTNALITQLSGVSSGAALAGGAVAGIAAAAALSFAKFDALAKEVGAFQRIAQTSAEDSSKLVAAFGDVGVSSQSAARGIGIMVRNLDSKAFKSLNIEIAKTKDGTTDVAATFLKVVEAAEKINDPIQRANILQAAFGRSYIQLLPLLERGSKAIKEQFADAGKDGQIIKQSDIDASKELSLALDGLGDKVGSLALKFGKALAPIAADIVGLAGDILDVATPVAGFFLDILIPAIKVTTVPIGLIRAAFSVFTEGAEIGLLRVKIALKEVAQATLDVVDRLTPGKIDDDKFGIEKDRARIKELKGEAKETGKALADMTEDPLAGANAYVDYIKTLREAIRGAGDAADAEREAFRNLSRAGLELQLGPAEDAFAAKKQARAEKEALEAGRKAVEQAYEGRQDALKGVKDAQDGVLDATKAVTDAEKAAADARKRLTDLYEAVPDALERVRRSEDGITDAIRNQARAVEDRKDAELAISDAKVAAKRAIEDQKFAIEDANKVLKGHAVEAKAAAKSVLELRDAHLAAQQTALDIAGGEAALERAVENLRRGGAGDLGERQRAVQQARLNIEKARQDEAKRLAADRERREKDAADAAKRSKDGLPAEPGSRDWIQAQRKIEDAARAVRDTGQAVEKSIRGLEDADIKIRDSGYAVADAYKARKDALKGVEEANQAILDQKDAIAKADQDVIDKRFLIKEAEDRVAEAKKKVAEANDNIGKSILNLEELETEQSLARQRRNAELLAGFTAATERQQAYTKATADFEKAQEAAYLARLKLATITSAQFQAGSADQRKALLDGAASGVSAEEQALLQRKLKLEKLIEDFTKGGVGAGVYKNGTIQSIIANAADGSAAKLKKDLADVDAQLDKISKAKPVGLRFDDKSIASDFTKAMDMLTKQPVAVPISLQLVDAGGAALTPVEIQKATKALFAVTGKFDGGDVSRGTPYIVGESHRGGRGELFIPNADGKIVSNAQILEALRSISPSSSKTVEVNIHTSAQHTASWLADVGGQLGGRI